MISKEAIGEKKEDTVLFLHGAWHGAWCWEKFFMPYFAKQGYDTYAINLRQHDNKGAVKGMNYNSIADYVEDLSNAVDQLDKDPIIIAHSMGGLVLQKYLEKRPCKKAILMAPVPVSGVLRVTNHLLFTTTYALPSILRLNLWGLVNSKEKSQKLFLSPDADKDVVDFCENNLCSESFKAFLNMLYPNIKINFHTKIPMLVIGAENDQIFTSKELTRTAKKYNADLKILPDMAHDMMLDTHHEKAAQEIIDWINN